MAHRRTTTLALVAALALARRELVPRLEAQTAGLPVRNAGVPTGIRLGADLGLSRAVMAPGEARRTSAAAGVTVTAGFGLVAASLTLARLDLAGSLPSATWVGAAASLRVFGGPLVPLEMSLQGGLAAGPDPEATGPSSGRPYRATLGIGAALTIPIPILAVTPWVAPRIERLGNHPGRFGGTRAAISAGIDFRSLGGLTVRTAFDSRAGWEAADEVPRVVSVGLGFSFP